MPGCGRPAPGMRGGWPRCRGGWGGATRRGPRRPRWGNTGIAAPRLRRDPGGALAPRALRVGFAARREDEVGAGRRLADQPRAGTDDQEPAVDTLAEVDAAARGGAAERTGGDLDPAGPQADGVVGGDDAGVAAAELVREVPRPRAPGGMGVGGGMGEAAVVVGQELGEVGVGGRLGDEAAQAELDDEAILQGAPEAFDAPLGLRGTGSPGSRWRGLGGSGPKWVGCWWPWSSSASVQCGSLRTKTPKRSPYRVSGRP